MTTMDFVTYKKYYEQEKADALALLLADNRIEYRVDEERESLDSLYGDKHFDKEFSVKLRAEDFARADLLLKEISVKEVENVERDHYLFSFTDEELFDILSKPDEWNEFDYELARKILTKRGKEVSAATLDLLKKQRLKALMQYEESPKLTIIAGYLFAILGGAIGVFIGWYLLTYKKVLPNGQRMYGFAKADRDDGRRIVILGAIFFVVYMYLRIAGVR
jgi:hypothetical protein